MNTVFEKFSMVISDKQLRKRVIFVILALVAFRFLASIPVPGVDTARLASFFANNQYLSIFNVFSGGGLSNLSIVMLGVSPYITASIIIQLLTMMSTKLKSISQDEGEAGRMRIAQYSRRLSIPLALIQSFGFLILLERSGAVITLTPIGFFINMMIITAGSVLLMWIGELITEFGIGNGTSIIIFSGIIAALPKLISQRIFAFEPSQLPLYVVLVVVALVVIAAVVFITEAERPIAITYAKQIRGNSTVGGQSTYLPLRLNQAGVIPIIFALSILLFPQVILNFLHTVSNPTIQMLAGKGIEILANQWLYAVMYFVLVVLFTYFYTAVTFDPNLIADNLQKGGAFISGIRPGESTAVYIAKVLTRITLVGALFLGVVAVLPLIVRNITGITDITIGGTALLIVVSVVLDIIKKIDSQVSMKEY